MKASKLWKKKSWWKRKAWWEKNDWGMKKKSLCQRQMNREERLIKSRQTRLNKKKNIRDITMACIFAFERLRYSRHAWLAEGIKAFNGFKLLAITSGVPTNTFEVKSEKDPSSPNRRIRMELLRRFYYLLCAARMPMKRCGLTGKSSCRPEDSSI